MVKVKSFAVLKVGFVKSVTNGTQTHTKNVGIVIIIIKM